MKRTSWWWVGLAVLFLALPARAKKEEPQYQSIEVKHFTQNEGIELPPDFTEFLYGALRSQLQKSKIFAQVLGEGEVVEAAAAEHSLVMEGNLVEYAKGNLAKTVIIGYGVGRRSLTVHVTVRRRSDNQVVFDKPVKVRAPRQQDPNALAKELAKEITRQLKGGLHH
jgi:hypothetical protein